MMTNNVYCKNCKHFNEAHYYGVSYECHSTVKYDFKGRAVYGDASQINKRKDCKDFEPKKSLLQKIFGGN